MPIFPSRFNKYMLQAIGLLVLGVNPTTVRVILRLLIWPGSQEKENNIKPLY